MNITIRVLGLALFAAGAVLISQLHGQHHWAGIAFIALAIAATLYGAWTDNMAPIHP